MGFKGAWLSYLLSRLGAQTVGFGRDDRPVLLYPTIGIANHVSHTGDINETSRLEAVLKASGASVLLHLAAQPIVLSSYADPLGTFQDNIMGTASVLQAARTAPGLEAVVVVTSDKVYRNNEWIWAYRETEPLGGHDPYSASKAAAEIVTQSMIGSFYGEAGAPGVATARAGNVIGGGDWADYRLLPDAARAFRAGLPLEIRNPASTRPWQHVLEPLVGYLQLAQALAEQRHAIFSRAWNFGPVPEDAVPVSVVAGHFASEWGNGARFDVVGATGPVRKEVSFLAVDASMARAKLDWQPRWRVEEAVRRTARWYREQAAGGAPESLMDRDIDDMLRVTLSEGAPV
jgi:CDP-glucose 4,6-dehydratase